MTRRSKIPLIVAIVGLAVAALVILERRPMAVSTVVEQAFGYRLKEEPTVIARKWEKPLAIQGVVYHEETTLRLSEGDYHALIAQLSADQSFEKKEFASKAYYERFVIGKEIVTWWSHDASTYEFSFSYTQY